MSPARYASLREQGKCCASVRCPGKLFEGTRYCRKHRYKQRRYQRAARRADYHRRKEEGRCVAASCRNPCRETGVHCEAHAGELAQQKRRWEASGDRHQHRLETQRKWRARNVRNGTCSICARGPLATKTLCEKHRRNQVRLKRLASSRKGIVPRAVKVRAIPAPRYELPRIDDYATARTYHEVG